MALSPDKKKQYRALAHNLNPVVTIAGKGLTEGVMNELERALEDHELIKIKLAVSDRELRKQVITQICSDTRSELVQEIGKVAVLFRPAAKPDPRKSNLL